MATFVPNSVLATRLDQRLPGRNAVVGADDLMKHLGLIPDSSAKHLQFVFRKNAMDHKNGVIASSTFKNISKRSLRQLINAWPKRVIQRTRLADVRAGTETYWKGLGETNPNEGVAARIEKRIGRSINRPLRKQHLLIPQGDMLINGKPRRVAQGGSVQQVGVRNITNSGKSKQGRLVGNRNVPILQSGTLEGTAVIKTSTGRLLLIQKLEEKKRGKFEKNLGGDGIKTRATSLGERMRVIGILKRTAKQAQPLDYFGSWDRGAAARDARYARMLDSIIRGQRAQAA